LAIIKATTIKATEVEVLAINSRQGVVNQLNWNVLKACKP
jgi:hypothetical protein